MRILVHNPGGVELLDASCPGDIAPSDTVAQLVAMVGERIDRDQSMEEETESEGEEGGEVRVGGEGAGVPVDAGVMPSLSLFESTHLSPLAPSTHVGLLAALADSLGVVSLTARHDAVSPPIAPDSPIYAPSTPSPVCVSSSPLCHIPNLDLDLSSAIERGPALSVLSADHDTV
ncbi:hypothetical protein KIPB_017134, partial [Kipferlia bialata]|eukprot:g17134.t1